MKIFIKKYRKQIKIILFILITSLTSIFIGMTLNSIVETTKISIEIDNFMKKGEYQESLSTVTNKYYKVPRETWMADIDSYVVINNRVTYGNSGDIIIRMKSQAGNLQITKDLVSYYFGGHAASVCYTETYKGASYSNNYCIESHYSAGVQKTYSGYWDNDNYKDEFLCLRVKASEEKKRKAFHYMADQIGKKYNHSYIFGTKNKYYCSDLISRAWQTAGIDLNYDGFYCSIQDIICSSKTYISFYKLEKNGIDYYYYLG